MLAVYVFSSIISMMYGAYLCCAIINDKVMFANDDKINFKRENIFDLRFACHDDILMLRNEWFKI
jgi:hypothetical protein